MAGKKISRNEPCPCGSGKKFKHCCINKGLDWQARQAGGLRKKLPLPPPRPEPTVPSGIAPLGPHRVIDTRLKEIAKGSPGLALWKELVERLTDMTPDEERMKAYLAVRNAGVLPPDAAWFAIAHAIEWTLITAGPENQEIEEPHEEDDRNDPMDQHTLDLLLRYGADDMAEMYRTNRLEFDRRHERGRQFFYGPPSEELARGLREQGILE
jgi:SEC-C motif